MDDVELAILDAWIALAPRLARDPLELRRRLARRRSATFARPPRSACLTLRANDHRLDDVRRLAPHDVTIAARQLHALCAPVTLESPGGSLDDVARLLGVSRGGLLRARVDKTFRQHYVEGLGGHWGHPRPILYTDAELDPNARGFAMPDPVWSWTTRYLAHRLSPDFPDQMLHRVPRYHARGGAGAADRYRDTRGLHPEHPLVAGHDSPPARRSLALPDPPPDGMAWYKWKDGVYLGYDWRNPLAKRNYKRHQRQLTKARLARKKRRMEGRPVLSERSKSKGSLEFRGWCWLCPTCDRPVRILYLPLPPVNLIESFHASRGDLAAFRKLVAIAAPGGESVREWGVTECGSNGKNRAPSLRHPVTPHPVTPHPVTPHPVTPHPVTPPRFACRKCLRLRSTSRGYKGAWNEIVTHLTGGLLFGHEVKRPTWFTPDRKNRYAPKPNRPPSQRRPQIERLLLAGRTIDETALALGLSKGTILFYGKQIYRQHNVACLKELLQKHGQPTRPHMRGPARGKRGEGRLRKRSNQPAATPRRPSAV